MYTHTYTYAYVPTEVVLLPRGHGVPLRLAHVHVLQHVDGHIN